MARKPQWNHDRMHTMPAVSGFTALVCIASLVNACLPNPLGSPSLPFQTPSSVPAAPASTVPGTAGPFTLSSVVPAAGLILGVSQAIQVTFTGSVAGGCTVAGPLGGAPTLSYSGSTVTVTPTANWNTGIGLTLDLTGCQEAGTGATADASIPYQVPNPAPGGTIYLKSLADGGNDANSGQTPALAKRTLGGALSGCAFPCVILAAGGPNRYPRDGVNVPQPYAVVGGYDTSFSTWDPTTYPTVFRDQTGVQTGTGANSPDFALRVQNAGSAYLRSVKFEALGVAGDVNVIYPAALWLTNSTVVLQGVTATGCGGACASASYGRGIYMDGNTNLLMNASMADGGSCAAGACTTYGLDDDGGTHTFTAVLSVFRGGPATGTSAAIHFSAGKSPFGGLPVLLEGSYLLGGSGSTTYALSAAGVALTGDIERSIFYGGNSSGQATGMTLTGFTSALRSNVIVGGASSGAMTKAIDCMSGCQGPIYNNLIHAGTPAVTQTSYGIFAGGGTPGPDIRNNIFTGWSGSGALRVCISPMGSSPKNLLHNAFYGCNPAASTGSTYDTIGTVTGALCTDSACGTPMPVWAGGTNANNVITTAAPGWQAPALLDYRFRSDGTALCSLTRGGLTIAAGEKDAGYATRTAPWSIGPYEYDGACQ